LASLLHRESIIAHNRRVGESVVPKDELRAAVEARKELGADMEPAVVDAFVDRIERRLAERADENDRSLRRKREHQKEMVLGAMGISVPLLAIAAIFTGLPGVLAVCAALAVIALAVAGRPFVQPVILRSVRSRHTRDGSPRPAASVPRSLSRPCSSLRS
jgi:cation transport ATPase